jgi:hypothetical protein
VVVLWLLSVCAGVNLSGQGPVSVLCEGFCDDCLLRGISKSTFKWARASKCISVGFVVVVCCAAHSH